MKNNTPIIVAAILIVMILVIVGASLSGNQSQPTSSLRSSLVSIDQMVGRPLPTVRLTDQTGAFYDLNKLKGRTAVLFFSEGLMCYPACWNQMAAFGTDPRFNSADTVAISVVADSPADWQKAAARMPELAKATVLFDTDAGAANQLGLLSAASSMHGGKFPGHTYVLLDRQGIIRRVLDDVSMSVNNDKIIKEILDLY